MCFESYALRTVELTFLFSRVDLVFAFNSRFLYSTIYTSLTYQRHVTCRLQALTAQTGQKRTRLRCLH